MGGSDVVMGCWWCCGSGDVVAVVVAVVIVGVAVVVCVVVAVVLADVNAVCV